MCGFAALFRTGHNFAAELLDAMEMDLYHRGPDSGGIVNEPGFALVFRRLSILDPVSASDQPMSDTTGRFTLVYNGEIYNFLDLRKTLQSEGVQFRTNGDTEVLLQGFMTWGSGVLERLEGMYAFVIVDRTERTVLAARDPFGIKPLYVAKTGATVAFASEMRPLQRLVGATPDPLALGELMTFGYAAGRLSNLQHIERVPGGVAVSLSLNGPATKERRFCDPLETLAPDESLTEKMVDEMALEGITRSVRTHLQSDVGYTAQLSGGVDSSLVTALTADETEAPLTTFGVCLGDYKYDETRYRGQVIERYRVQHQEIRLTGVDFAAALPRAVRHMEGPTPHAGCVMLMLLCDQIRTHSKVVLTGEGADEMLGGYMRYGLWRELARKTRLASLVPGSMWRLLPRYRELQRYSRRDPAIYAAVQHDFLSMWELFPELIPKDGWRQTVAARFPDLRERLFAVDQSAYLQSLLARQDKMAMAASLEARVPFTHLPLARVLNRIPYRLRAPGGRETKPVLKRIAERYLPHDLVYRRKVGLVLPLVEWAADERCLGGYLECLTATDCRLAEYTPLARLRQVVAAFRAGQRIGLPSVPQLINLEMWLRSLAGRSSTGAQ